MSCVKSFRMLASAHVQSESVQTGTKCSDTEADSGFNSDLYLYTTLLSWTLHCKQCELNFITTTDKDGREQESHQWVWFI